MAARSGKADRYPRAPTQEEWDALSPEERARVVEALPGEVTYAEMSPPEGDRHFQAKVKALDTLRGHFARQRRRVYLAAEMPVYYPGARRFAPDLMAVLEAEAHERDKWVVSAEGKGLDFVLEVHVGGPRRKDARDNVVRYASLGIPEYFIYDRRRQRLHGYRLPAPEARVYELLEPSGGVYVSEQLGVELRLEEGRLRFYSGRELLLEPEEVIARLEQLTEGLQRRVDEEARLAKELRRRVDEEARRAEESRRRADEEAKELRRRADEEARLRQEAQRQVEELRAELERLRRGVP
ncbi:Uma2 family endonuclease [Cystobacter fuscus]|uniref:Uma2 family endonuclease n=1 Tax=Cystobacter fuscus TaxID=43 RepID=UPI002B30F12A|nr:Uma2 family endonuclease [Cystobacter fuscus]